MFTEYLNYLKGNFTGNIIQKENGYMFEIYMVGFTKDDIKITTENKIIDIIATQKKLDDNKNYIIKTTLNDVYHKFKTPFDIISCDAEYTNGILYLDINCDVKNKKTTVNIK